MTTRIFNALIGIWLFVTAFMWGHTQAEMTVTIVAAILTFALAILAIYTRAARYVNAIVAVLLFLSVLTLPSLTRATQWNNAIVAIAIFVAALVDNGPQAIRRERELYGGV
jgi:divalent metal cation (Fe/Co/Zn/Cd) transporter